MTTALDEARRLAPDIAARSAEIEEGRAVPADIVAALGRAGAFRLLLPVALGGPGAGPATVIDVIETLARADGSVGWTTLILNSSLFSAWLEPAVAKEMIAALAPEQGMAGNVAPFGKAIPQPDGSYQVSGRWPFNSGSHQAGWFAEGVLMPGGPPGPETWRFAYFPAADATVLDTWKAAGLRGTASHDVAAEGVRVPAERFANPVFGHADHDDPQFRWALFSLLGSLLTGFPLGVARRALDEFTALATRKGRGGPTPLAAEQISQVAVPKAEGQLRAARAQVDDAVGAAWDHACRGDRLTLELRLGLRIGAQHAMDTAVGVVDTLFHIAGGSSVYDDRPLQRCWRDVHVGSHHIFFSDQHRAVLGRAMLGQPTDEFLI